MNIIDLSHTISDTISVFKEDELPAIITHSTHLKDGYAQKKLILYSHTSTHVDAPFHILPGTPTLDNLPLEQFFGPGVLADCRNCKGDIKIDFLEKYKEKLEDSEYLIIWTGWYEKWKKPGYKKDFPCLTSETARWLLQFDLKGIGIDAISIDRVESTELSNHHILLKNNTLIIENLTNLEELHEKDFNFCCFPLKYENADGSPVRAVGIVSDK